MPRGFGNHILVVDDDEAVRWTIGAALREAGYSVTPCANGAEALWQLRKAEFDVVLTDLRLGDVDGLQVLDGVQRACPDTVTLLLTGYASVESAIAALRHGVYDYLCKPCAPEELLATVERALERRHLTQQVRQQLRSLETAIDTARELHSALSSRLEGTTALLREREHVLVTICTELRTSLIAIAGLVDILLARGRDGLNDDLPEYLERIRAEAHALAERVNGALLITRSECVELPADSNPVELAPITLESVPATVSLSQ